MSETVTEASASDADGGQCSLCALPTPDPPVTDAAVEGTYCCRGCLEVARSLGGADAPGGTDAGESTVGDPAAALDTGGDVGTAEGERHFFTVDGMHCATCEAFVEARATDVEGVSAAAGSYPADALQVVYDPDRTDPGTVRERVSGLGYEVRGRSPGPAADDGESLGRLLVGGFFGMMTMLWYVLFLYPAYLGLPGEALLVDVAGPAGTYLLANAWLMATVVLGYTGYPLLRGAYVSLRTGHPNMDLLVALAASTAYVYSTLALAAGRTEVYFDITVVVVLAVTLGSYYEDAITRKAVGSLTDLTAERVETARRRTTDGAEPVDVADLEGGEELVVRAGERVPVDGTVIEGTGSVDESLVTGESVPVRKEPGDEVLGGALLADGGLVVSAAEDATSTLDRLVEHLWAVQSGRPGVQCLADRLAALFVPGVLVLATVATGLHLLAGAAPTAALLTGLAVLVVSCPCALGLATPLAVAAGVRDALAEGAVVTDTSAVERATGVDVVALDKTGTLTTGEMGLRSTAGAAAMERAAALEQFADHPVAAAVREHADPPDATVTDVERVPGKGIAGRVDGEQVLVGGVDLFESREWAVPADLRERAGRARADGAVPSLVGWDGRARDVFVADDRPRGNWADVVADLAADHRVVVITGDDERAARRFREAEGVESVFAGVPPEGKAAVVERLEGTVAMVGDGSNDAPALAAADLGVAMDRGTELAADAADIVVTGGDLAAVPRALDVLAGARRRVRQNLAWALCYNAVALPVAVAGLLNPLVAAVAMAASSLLVVANSARSL